MNPQVSNAWPAYIAAGPFMFFGGQLGYARDGTLVTCYAEAPDIDSRKRTSFAWVGDMEAPVGAQGIAIYERYLELLAREGGNLDYLLRYHIYQRDKHFFSVFDRIRRTFETRPPSSTAVGFGRFDPTGLATLCIDAIALRPSAEKEIGARTVLAGSARHLAPATFSNVIGVGDYLFLAGQIPIDTSKPGAPLIRGYSDIPEEGQFLRVGRSHEDARNGPIAAQTWFTYDLIRQHLEAAGSSLDQILNLVVYLQDIRDFPTFHRVHEAFFSSSPPALTVIESTEVGHKGTLIEIEPTAILPSSKLRRQVMQAPGWHAPAQMSAVVCAGGLAFCSGVIGTDRYGTLITSIDSLPEDALSYIDPEMPANEYALQTAAAIANLAWQLKEAGRNLINIAHLTVYLRDISEFCVVEAVLCKALGDWRPALTLLQVPAVAPVRGARVSLTAIGWFGEGDLDPHYY